MARPSKLTPESQARIVQAIEVGATYELAAQFGGVVYTTFNDWMKRGEDAKSGRFYEFYNAIKAAEGKAAIKWLALIDKAATDSWQAAAWKLERRYPETFGRRVVQNELSGNIGVNADITYSADSLAKARQDAEKFEDGLLDDDSTATD